MLPTTKGLVYYQGGCNDCDAYWASANVIGLAAQHAERYGHETWAEMGYAYRWSPS